MHKILPQAFSLLSFKLNVILGDPVSTGATAICEGHKLRIILISFCICDEGAKKTQMCQGMQPVI